MGSLLHSAWDTKELKKEHNLRVAVETGTAYCEGTKYLSEIFEKVFTIEMDADFFNVNSEILSQLPNVQAYLGKTVDKLPEILEANKDEPTFFWLDAHLPRKGQHTYAAGCFIEQSYSDEINFPLEQELRTIIKNKNVLNDVFLIDDLRIYEDGPYEVGNWEERYQYTNILMGYKFVYDLFEETHSIEKSFKDEGYLLIKPL